MENELTMRDMERMFANPYYAITVDETLTYEHEPLISKEDWVQANINMIEDMGLEKWMHTLLDVLEGDYLTNGEV